MRALIQSKPLSIAHASLRIQSYSYLRSADARPSSSFKVNAARRRQRGSTDTESPPPVDTAAMAPQASSKQRQKSSGTTKNLQGPPTAAPSGSTDHLAGGAASKAQAPPPTQPAAAAHTTPEALASAQKEDQLQKAPRAKPTPTHPPTRAKEQELWDQGFKNVGGVDEAGTGALAGPVVAVCCMIPKDASLPLDLRSNQKISDKRRREVFRELQRMPGFIYSSSFVDVDMIDQMNPRAAALCAMENAVGGMPLGSVDYLLVDGNAIPEELPLPAEGVIKGAESVAPLSAASVICKCLLDDVMLNLDKQFPEYGFAQHKGYGSARHRDAIQDFGPKESVHRRNFKPAKDLF